MDTRVNEWLEECEKTNGTKAVDDIRVSIQENISVGMS